MESIFKIVYSILIWLSTITGLTYNEINIIVYYIIIPFIYFHLIDRLLKIHYFKIGWLALIVMSFFIMDSFKSFSNRLFQLSVDFLNWFDIIGLNYVQASVVICVFVPIIVYLVLFYLVIWKKKRATLGSSND